MNRPMMNSFLLKILCLVLPFALIYGIFKYKGGVDVPRKTVQYSHHSELKLMSLPKTTTKTPEKIDHKSRALAGTFDLQIEPNPLFKNLTVLQASKTFLRLVQNFKTNCTKVGRYGRPGDGGYLICMDKKVAPQPNKCLVYSFGIRNEWSFDDDVHDKLGCEVHSFDPSMTANDHKRKERLFFHKLGVWDRKMTNDMGWKLAGLQDIINMLGHNDRDIDYLKIDVEGAEWPMLKEMLRLNSAKRVKQMIFEIHTPKFKNNPMNVADYGQIHKDMSELETKLGFKLWQEKHINGCCDRFSVLTPAKYIGRKMCCYELFYINKRYL